MSLKPGSNPEIARATVVYIDDEPNNLVAFKAVFRREFDIHTALSADAASEFLNEPELKVIISDQRMPDKTGVQFFAEIKNSHPGPMRILLTGYSNLQAVVSAINDGEVYRYLTKPWKADEMRAVIVQAIEVFDLRKENERLVEDLRRTNGQLEFYLRQKLLE